MHTVAVASTAKRVERRRRAEWQARAHAPAITKDDIGEDPYGKKYLHGGRVGQFETAQTHEAGSKPNTVPKDKPSEWRRQQERKG
jgi:hypothetical protein